MGEEGGEGGEDERRDERLAPEGARFVAAAMDDDVSDRRHCQSHRGDQILLAVEDDGKNRDREGGEDECAPLERMLGRGCRKQLEFHSGHPRPTCSTGASTSIAASPTTNARMSPPRCLIPSSASTTCSLWRATMATASLTRGGGRSRPSIGDGYLATPPSSAHNEPCS